MMYSQNQEQIKASETFARQRGRWIFLRSMLISDQSAFIMPGIKKKSGPKTAFKGKVLINPVCIFLQSYPEYL